MKKIFVGVSALALLLTASLASADEAKGTLQEINMDAQTITMDDGTSYRLAEDVSLEGIEVGEEVTVSFEEQGDDKIVTEIVPGN